MTFKVYDGNNFLFNFTGTIEAAREFASSHDYDPNDLNFLPEE